MMTTIRNLLLTVVAVTTMAGSALAAVPAPKAAVPPMREKIESKINWGMDGAPINELKAVRDPSVRDQLRGRERQQTMERNFCERTHGCGGYSR